MTHRDVIRQVIRSIDYQRLDDPEYHKQLRAASDPHIDGIREEAELDRASEPPPLVYFIRLGTRIKIGTTTNLVQRLMQLPVEELLGTIIGGYEMEQELHKRFAQYRVVGEWFVDCPPIRAFIAAARADAAEAIIVDSSVVAEYLSCDEDRIRKLVARGILTPVGTTVRSGRGGRPRNTFDLRQVQRIMASDTLAGGQP